MSLLPMPGGMFGIPGMPDIGGIFNRGPSWLPSNAGFGNPGVMQNGGGFRELLRNPDFAMALLANSGGQQKKSFGEVLGQAGLQSQQMGQQREDNEFQRMYRQAQMEQLGKPAPRKPIPVIGPDGKPVLVSEDEAIGKQPYAGGNDAKPSALIQAYNLARDQGYTGSILEFQTDLAKASAQYPYTEGDVAGVPSLIPRINPNTPSKPQPNAFSAPALPVRPLSSLATEADAKRTLASAGASGSELGQSVAKAEFDLPRVEANAQLAKADIDKLINHPGRKWITGATSVAPIVPGTPQADADALAKKIQGQTFLQAYQSLKGGGAITEVEGQKAEQAIAALSRAQTDEAYVAALKDLKGVLDRGLEKARKQASMGKPKDNDPLGLR